MATLNEEPKANRLIDKTKIVRRVITKQQHYKGKDAASLSKLPKNMPDRNMPDNTYGTVKYPTDRSPKQLQINQIYAREPRTGGSQEEDRSLPIDTKNEIQHLNINGSEYS